MVEDALVTEAGSDPRAGYESRETLELVELMNAADATVPSAVAAASSAIAAAIDAIAERTARRRPARLRRRRLVGSDRGARRVRVRGDLLHRSRARSSRSSPEARPHRRSSRRPPRTTATPGRRTSRRSQLGAADAVVGVSASGPTPYVLGALDAAEQGGRAHRVRRLGTRAPSSARSSTTRSPSSSGPEFLAGSTRLKAGTAQKLVLNTISTISMIRLGKTYGNLMVDVVAANEKLQDRVRRIVGRRERSVVRARSTTRSPTRTGMLGSRSSRSLAGVDADEARARLDESGGSIARALEAAP